ncbi:hypothetical protein [Paenibacillus sp. NAIST15-1]|uniref:hypothetical protein n=1 Tax=Paenibacillus sp. NAIST15-1 TaxID=1605994 RepID=UPI00086D67DC|nr:hypothetical protein [Paenibacillus sp. NAIST15-1]GAV11345.1 hypothetical protein PBN151_1272 [Paenibacillus sp. NAIST15-1]
MKFNFEDSEELKPVSWIDVWYDRRQRLWTAILKNDDDFQIGDAEYGSKSDIGAIVESWINEYELDRTYISKKQIQQKKRH